MAAEYVRVRDTSGHEITVRAGRVAEGVEVLDKPAVSLGGTPLPPKYRTQLGTPLPGSKKAQQQAAKKAAAPKTTPAQPEPSPGQSADHQEEN